MLYIIYILCDLVINPIVNIHKLKLRIRRRKLYDLKSNLFKMMMTTEELFSLPEMKRYENDDKYKGSQDDDNSSKRSTNYAQIACILGILTLLLGLFKPQLTKIVMQHPKIVAPILLGSILFAFKHIIQEYLMKKVATACLTSDDQLYEAIRRYILANIHQQISSFTGMCNLLNTDVRV